MTVQAVQDAEVIAGSATAEAEDVEMIAQLAELTKALEVLGNAWDALPPNGTHDPTIVPRLLAQDEQLRASLKACPMGDPSETTTIPRHQCHDPVVSAHGAATKAAVEAELARVQWEVRSLEAMTVQQGQVDGADLPGLLINAAVLHLRLFDIDGAYMVLQRAAEIGTSDPRLNLLTRYCAQLKAPRSDNFLDGVDLSPGGRAEALLGQVREVFSKSTYTTKMVLTATKASSMSEFIFVESRADTLERGLLESIEEPNPMKQETSGPQVPIDLVDLLRVFLLHRVLPLARMSQLFGAECVKLLLELQVLTAIDGESCQVVPPATAVAAVNADNVGCGAYFVISNVAFWPVEEDLLIATDFEQTFSSEGLEPVMYISEDSLALVCGAPRGKVSNVLDVCCGSGIQGIVALRHYAERATFLDLNPRAVRFTKFNLAFNGFSHRVDGLHLGNLYNSLPPSATFDAIVANPPFVPNPQGIASGAGAMFGNGGDTGEDVFSAIVQGASQLLRSGGRLSVVSMAPNVEELPERIKSWYCAKAGSDASFDAVVFRGNPTPAKQYLPTSSSVETHRYQAAFDRMGIHTLSEIVTVLTIGAPGSGGARVSLAGGPRDNLWSDHTFLRLVVQRADGGDDASPSFSPPTRSVPHSEVAAAAAQPEPAPAPPPPPPPPPKAEEPRQPQPVPAAAAGKEESPKREGNLPGFQNGFFPAYCTGPSPEWEATARELGRIARSRPVLQR